MYLHIHTYSYEMNADLLLTISLSMSNFVFIATHGNSYEWNTTTYSYNLHNQFGFVVIWRLVVFAFLIMAQLNGSFREHYSPASAWTNLCSYGNQIFNYKLTFRLILVLEIFQLATIYSDRYENKNAIRDGCIKKMH